MIDSVSIGSFTGFKAHAFVAHSGRTNCVAVGPRSGQVIATGGDDKVSDIICAYARAWTITMWISCPPGRRALLPDTS